MGSVFTYGWMGEERGSTSGTDTRGSGRMVSEMASECSITPTDPSMKVNGETT